MKIYIDLDGVLADFEGGFEKKYKINPNKLDKKELKSKYKTHFAKERFFLELPMFSGAQSFVKAVQATGHDVEILTAVSEFDSVENAKQKEQWVTKNFGKMKFNWVKKSKDKFKYASSDALLIDDRAKATAPFSASGGQIILHVDFKKTLNELEFFKESKMLSFKDYINEVAIQFGKKAYPKFGNVVILQGGAGSGKGFVTSNLLSIEGRVFDVDKIKSLAIASTTFAAKVKEETGVDLKSLDLRNPDDVRTAHEILGNLYKVNKKLFDASFSTIAASHPDRKPNLIFDVTLKDMAKMKDIATNLENLGYAKENIHLVWVMNDFNVAVEQNKNRERVVPDEIMFATHEGASLTFIKLLSMGSALKKYMDGDIVIAFNRIFVDSEVEKSKTSSGSYIKSANYIRVKDKGKPQTPLGKLDKEVIDKIRKYVPKTITWG